jgi:hypothetical protein
MAALLEMNGQFLKSPLTLSLEVSQSYSLQKEHVICPGCHKKDRCCLGCLCI